MRKERDATKDVKLKTVGRFFNRYNLFCTERRTKTSIKLRKRVDRATLVSACSIYMRLERVQATHSPISTYRTTTTERYEKLKDEENQQQ